MALRRMIRLIHVECDPEAAHGYHCLIYYPSRIARRAGGRDIQLTVEDPTMTSSTKIIGPTLLVLMFGMTPAVAQDQPEPTVDPELEELVAAAVTALADRLEADPESIEVVSARKVMWRDGSLGCPKPDMMYIQAIQEGALIELRRGEELYRYHSNLQGPPFLCETPQDPLPAEE